MCKKIVVTLTPVTALLLGACQSTGIKSNPVYQPVATTDDFAELEGKKLLFTDGQYLVIESDGTIDGFFGGKRLEGTWEVTDGYWCRTFTAGPDYAMKNPVDCQQFEKAGNSLKMTRDKGRGKSFNYTISQ